MAAQAGVHPNYHHHARTHHAAAKTPRVLVLSRPVAWIGGVVFVLTVVWAAGSTWLAFFHDDFVGRLLSRQTQMQYAYENRLGALRAEIDRITSRQLLDQDSFEQRVSELLSRQSQLETRQAVVAALASETGLSTGQKAQVDDAPADEVAVSAPLPAPRAAREKAAATPSRSKPRPLDGLSATQDDVSKADSAPERTQHATIVRQSGPLEERLRSAGHSMSAVEKSQMNALAAMEKTASHQLEKIQSVVAETGLKPPAPETDAPMGGPYEPLNLGDNADTFQEIAEKVQATLSQTQHLRHFLLELPLGYPFAHTHDVTSDFGTRTDPFTGRLALHPGIDLRADWGAPVHATGGGTVLIARPYGGYGNMVEIDNGNGIVTRYGHLSAILVHEGDTVTKGEVIGHVGSTGRSTGPHLHYETRIDGDAVNPNRFLSVGQRLLQAAN